MDAADPAVDPAERDRISLARERLAAEFGQLKPGATEFVTRRIAVERLIETEELVPGAHQPAKRVEVVAVAIGLVDHDGRHRAGGTGRFGELIEQPPLDSGKSARCIWILL